MTQNIFDLLLAKGHPFQGIILLEVVEFHRLTLHARFKAIRMYCMHFPGMQFNFITGIPRASSHLHRASPLSLRLG